MGSGSTTSTLRTSAPRWSSRLARRGWSFADAIEAGVFTVPGDGAIVFAPIFDAKSRAYPREVLGW
jgi:inosose dehydratase